MRYKPEACKNEFIKKALETIGEMNKIAHKNYCSTLMKVRTQQTKTENLDPYLEYVLSLDTRAYFIENPIARAAINLFVNRNITTMDKIIKEILYPTIAIREGVLNRRMPKCRSGWHHSQPSHVLGL